MYRFSENRSVFSDDNHGTITFCATGVSHDEELDTFFILYKEDCEALMRGEVVKEKHFPVYDNKWKPKTLKYEKGYFTIEDPSHLIEVNGRKKLVKGVVTGQVAEHDLRYFITFSAQVAFFELSMMTLKTSKEKKLYEKGLESWKKFNDSIGLVSSKTLMLLANRSYYTLIPGGELKRSN